MFLLFFFFTITPYIRHTLFSPSTKIINSPTLSSFPHFTGKYGTNSRDIYIMAYQRMDLVLVLVLVTMLWAGAMAQSSSCTNTIISLSPCLNYITGNSSTPSSGCCTQLANVVRSSPECLCQVLNGGGSSLGLNINQTQALALPGACKVQTPSISRCNSASPANSPTESQDTPSTIPSGSGSKTVPTTEDGTSDGSSSKLSSSLLFFLLFAASYASAFTTF